jgi:drug/metabolite transporter (DMT)-like permease
LGRAPTGRRPAVVALLAATVVRGSTFLVTKQSLPELAPGPFLTWRFGIAAAVLLALRPQAVGDGAVCAGSHRPGRDHGRGHRAAFPPSEAAWPSLAYLSLVATCLGFVVQAWAQSALTATTAAVIMTMEPVFAAALAVGVGGEALVPAGWLGGLLIVAAMSLAELGS